MDSVIVLSRFFLVPKQSRSEPRTQRSGVSGPPTAYSAALRARLGQALVRGSLSSCPNPPLLLDLTTFTEVD